MTFDSRTMMPTNPGDEGLSVEFETIKTPLPCDILCGKNKICIKHEGSKNFRRIIESYTLKYQQASSRNEKMEVTKEIFDKLQTRRFLKYNEDTDMWETLHPLAVRDKIGHALRFSNRKGSSAIRKQVRRSTSDLSALKKADLSLRSSTSMGSMEALKGSLSSVGGRNEDFRFSTGSMPQYNGLLQQNTDLNLIGKVNDASMAQAVPSLTAIQLAGAGALNQRNSIAVSNPSSQLRMGATSGGVNPDDLSWMLQMPLMEVESDGKVYFANGQVSNQQAGTSFNQQQQLQQQQQQQQQQQFNALFNQQTLLNQQQQTGFPFNQASV